MTSPSKVSDGEMSQFKGLLTNGGLTAELIHATIDDPGIAKAMVDGGKTYLEQITKVYPIPSSYHGPYWNERAEGPYWTYPEGWPEERGGPAILFCDPKFFPGLDFSQVERLRERLGRGEVLTLPEHMTALLVCPKLESVAGRIRQNKKSWEPVNIAMEYLLGVLREVYGTHGFNRDPEEIRVGPEHHRLTESTAKALALDAARTPGDVHILPIQSGALFAGYSVRASRGHLSAMPNHYGMHSFGGGIIMLPYPDRQERFIHDRLFMDCPGTEQSPVGDGSFDHAPFCWFDEGMRKLSPFYLNEEPSACAGSGSFVVLPPVA